MFACGQSHLVRVVKKAALPSFHLGSVGRGLMCINYITVKASLSGSGFGHMCKWGIFTDDSRTI